MYMPDLVEKSMFRISRILLNAESSKSYKSAYKSVQKAMFLMKLEFFAIFATFSRRKIEIPTHLWLTFSLLIGEFYIILMKFLRYFQA